MFDPVAKTCPKFSAFAVCRLTVVHLIDALGAFLMAAINRHAGALLLPLLLFPAVFSTNTGFLGMPGNGVSLMILPAVSLIALFLTRRVGTGAASVGAVPIPGEIAVSSLPTRSLSYPAPAREPLIAARRTEGMSRGMAAGAASWRLQPC